MTQQEAQDRNEIPACVTTTGRNLGHLSPEARRDRGEITQAQYEALTRPVTPVVVHDDFGEIVSGGISVALEVPAE